MTSMNSFHFHSAVVDWVNVGEYFVVQKGGYGMDCLLRKPFVALSYSYNLQFVTWHGSWN